MDVNLSNRSTTFNSERLLKPNEVADFLSISRSFAYQLLQAGAIPVVRLGKTCRVRPQDLEAFIEQNIHSQADNT
jgi:excisionase family DNA binding protein